MKTKTKPEPKLKIGDHVSCPPTLYNETYGTITEVDEIFKMIRPDGSFEPRGLCHLKSTIKDIAIPYEFDGETLTIHFPAGGYGNWTTPAHDMVSKFKGYAYTIKTPQMNSVFNESRLKVIK